MKRNIVTNDIIFNEYTKAEPGRIDGRRTIRYTGPGEKDMYKTGGSRRWRNNNPGNIICGPFARKNGAIGCDGIMAIFPDNETGEKSQRTRLTIEGWEEKTIRKAISDWAPEESGNPTEQYIEYVSQTSGMPRDKKIRDMYPDEFDRFFKAMKKFENTTPGETRTDDNPPDFTPGEFQTKRKDKSSSRRLVKADTSTRRGGSRTGKSRRASRAGCRETLEREGKRVYRKEPDCGTRGFFYSD